MLNCYVTSRDIKRHQMTHPPKFELLDRFNQQMHVLTSATIILFFGFNNNCDISIKLKNRTEVHLRMCICLELFTSKTCLFSMIQGFLSPLTFSCCCAWKCANCTKMNEVNENNPCTCISVRNKKNLLLICS